MKAKAEIMNLCHKCKDDYESTGEHRIRRTYKERDGMEKYTKCPRIGWEYKITTKRWKRERT